MHTRTTTLALAAATALAGASACAQDAPALDPVTTGFLASLDEAGPIHTLGPEAARAAFSGIQGDPPEDAGVVYQDRTLPVGPTGFTRVRVYRPATAVDSTPIIVYLHGGGWVLGGTDTHDRLMRELSAGTDATVVIVDYTKSPEARYPTATEQAYAALRHVAENAERFAADADRIAIAGDGTGGNMAAVVGMLAKERGGPELAAQLLFCPATDAAMDTESHEQFSEGPWLTGPAMAWFWEQYLPDGSARDNAHVSPVNATPEQLAGLPPALVITAGHDVLRDEGEAYARRLELAGVRVTATRYDHAIHDFVVLNPLAETPAARAAVAQGVAFLRDAFGED